MNLKFTFHIVPSPLIPLKTESIRGVAGCVGASRERVAGTDPTST